MFEFVAVNSQVLSQWSVYFLNNTKFGNRWEMILFNNFPLPDKSFQKDVPYMVNRNMQMSLHFKMTERHLAHDVTFLVIVGNWYPIVSLPIFKTLF